MAANEPLYLTVGTDVSARYKGAFCEAKVKKVNRSVKCKVIFANNLGTLVLPDDQIRGTFRVNMHVEAKHPEKNQYSAAIITKIFDYSQYTVVFDDGDETTLRRTSLCLKSGRHFAESETLDQLPLTNPEHFGIPVLGSKTKRKRRSIASCSSMDGDSSSEELHSKRKRDLKKDYESDIAKVVCVEMGDKRKKDNWFPGLIVSPTSQDIKINSKDHYLVRSFKDGKYYQVKKKETRMFTKEIGAKVENNLLKTAVEKANLYLNKDEIPPHWDWDLMMGQDDDENDDQDTDIETSDDEPSEEKDRFVAQLYKFMDERGTPINRAPTVSGRDLNLYKLFNIVQQMGGYNRVTNQNKWRTIYTKMGLIMTNPACSIQIKKAYKRYLHSFEDFNRKLGCTMVSNTRSGHTRYRSDRNIIMTRKREQNLPLMRSRLSRGAKVKNQRKNEESVERRSRLSRMDESENKQKEESKSSNFTESKREKIETRGSLKNEQEKNKCTLNKEKKKEKATNGKAKEEKFKEKVKVNTKDMGKDKNILIKVKTDEEKDQLKKKIGKTEDKDSGEKLTLGESEVKSKRTETVVRIGDRIRVKYGNGKQHKKYEAKVLKIERESGERKFYVHYTGWNVRYDEWIKKNKIVEVIENKNGSERKKKGVLWPGSKSKALVKRSKLFKLSLRKNNTQTLAKSSKISKNNTSMISRTRRQESVSDSLTSGGLQTRKLRRKPIDSDNEMELSANRNDSESAQILPGVESELNSSNETIKLEFVSDTEELSVTKNDDEIVCVEKETKSMLPDDESIKMEQKMVRNAEDIKASLLISALAEGLNKDNFSNTSKSPDVRTNDSSDPSYSYFNTSTTTFLPCANIKVEKNWELENFQKPGKILEPFNSIKETDRLEMPDISNDDCGNPLNLETLSTKSESEEKEELKSEETTGTSDPSSFFPPEILWKVEKIPDSIPVINDEPPPLEKKPDFSPDAGEERYQTRPELERAVSETEELSCKIPNISIQDNLKNYGGAELMESECGLENYSYRDQTTEMCSELELKNLECLPCHSSPSKSEEWTDPDQPIIKKEKRKKNKMFKTENQELDVAENHHFSSKSDPENQDSKEEELKKKSKKDKRRKLKKFNRDGQESEKDIVDGLDYSKKEKKGEEESTGSIPCANRRGESCRKLKKCRKTKDKTEPWERKTKRKKKKKDIASDPEDRSQEDCVSSDSEKGVRPKKNKKEKKKCKKKSQPWSEEWDGQEQWPEKLEGADTTWDGDKSSDQTSFLLCRERVPASPEIQPPHLSSWLSSEPEQSDGWLPPISQSSPDFSTTASSKGVESGRDLIGTAEASAVLDNTPPTTPESAPSYLSGSPAYDSTWPVEGNGAKEADDDSSHEEPDKEEITESEDSLSQTESAILFLANQAVSRKNDSQAKSSAALKHQSPEMEEVSSSKRKRTSKCFASDTFRSSNAKRTCKSPRGESKECVSGHSSASHRCGLVATTAASQSRTSKFNFYVPLDAYTDPDKRIAILQDSLSELKKTYMALKAEVALIDRHRKKAKKKEKETVIVTDPRPDLSVPPAEMTES